MAAGKWTS